MNGSRVSTSGHGVSSNNSSTGLIVCCTTNVTGAESCYYYYERDRCERCIHWWRCSKC